MVNPRLSLPYWDSTLDNDMENPVNSIIWTPEFLGNGDGRVTTGPFSNWMTPPGPLTRNIGSGSRLFDKNVVRRILTRCRTRQISDPTADANFNLEIFHGGPHNWVGGLMAGLNTAAHDPIFFLHHAYVDYIWEMFRLRQVRFCRVNPSMDYPMAMGLHAAERIMDGLPPYRNIDGYMNYWTMFWYRYESAPTCSRFRRFCGSPYLRCNRRRRCVSVARRVAPGGPEARGVMFSASVTSNSGNAQRARAQESSLNIGPRFRAPPSEPRTQDGQRRLRGRRSARNQPNRQPSSQNDLNGQNRSHQNNPFMTTKNTKLPYAMTPIKSPVKRRQHLDRKRNLSNIQKKSYKRFRAPPSDGRTTDVLKKNIASGVSGGIDYVFDPSIYEQSKYMFQESFPLLPPVEFNEQTNENIVPPIRDTLSLNTQAFANRWVFVPVKVVHNRTKSSHRTSVVDNLIPRLPHSQGCSGDSGDQSQIQVQSQGLSYDGYFTDYAFINATLPMDYTTAYIAMKSPQNESVQAMILGIYGCGQICQTHCLVPGVIPRQYKPCTGVITLSASDSGMYSNTYEGAMSRTKQGRAGSNQGNDAHVKVVLYCAQVENNSLTPTRV